MNIEIDYEFLCDLEEETFILAVLNDMGDLDGPLGNSGDHALWTFHNIVTYIRRKYDE